MVTNQYIDTAKKRREMMASTNSVPYEPSAAMKERMASIDDLRADAARGSSNKPPEQSNDRVEWVNYDG